MKMIRITVIIVGVVFIVALIPVLRFMYVNFKAGWDGTARAAAATQPVADAIPSPGKPANVDFDKLDFSQNTTDVHNRTDHFTATLPPMNGGGRNGSYDGMIGQGNFQMHGSIQSIHGASRTRLPSVPHAGGMVTIDLVVEQGNVRVYLSGQYGHTIDGYVFADASPGKPARVRGYMGDWSDSGTPEQTFVLEAREGDAAGISYRVFRRD